MPKLQKAVTVKAPVTEVFSYLDEPMHLPEIWPSLFEVKDVETMPDGRHHFLWRYNMGGRSLAGETETLERIANERIVDRAKGEIESTFTWKLQGENGTTTIAFEADYTLPPGLDEKLERYLMRHNELEAALLLESLKARLEV